MGEQLVQERHGKGGEEDRTGSLILGRGVIQALSTVSLICYLKGYSLLAEKDVAIWLVSPVLVGCSSDLIPM